MNKFQLSLFLALGAPVVSPLAAATAQDAPKPDAPKTAANLLTNGGFENWQDISPEDKAKPDNAATGGNIAQGYWFGSEAYERAQDPKFPIHVAITKDDATKHGGQSSVRLQNQTTTDIGNVVLQPITITPGFQYTLRGWMKGDNIVQDAKTGAGITMWTNAGPKQDFWAKMSNDAHFPTPKDGTFDWTPFEIKFDVPANADQVMFSLQLRRASGTLWLDDVELVAGQKLEVVPNF